MVVLLESLWELPRTGSYEMSNCQELSPRLGGIGALKKKKEYCSQPRTHGFGDNPVV